MMPIVVVCCSMSSASEELIGGRFPYSTVGISIRNNANNFVFVVVSDNEEDDGLSSW